MPAPARLLDFDTGPDAVKSRWPSVRFLLKNCLKTGLWAGLAGRMTGVSPYGDPT